MEVDAHIVEAISASLWSRVGSNIEEADACTSSLLSGTGYRITNPHWSKRLLD